MTGRLLHLVTAADWKDARARGTLAASGDGFVHLSTPEQVQLPADRLGLSSLRFTWVMAGPGVKRGARVERTVWLTDVCPTICHLADLPIPRDCEGAIAYQALEEMP